MFNTEIKHKWILSFIVVLLLFLAVSVFLFPLFNSGDDVFLMFTLAGGYGEAPTNLLHYNHIWHPLLGWIIKSLFLAFPAINWYTVLLMLFQVSSCIVILYVLFHRLQWLIAMILFLVFFSFFEIGILLSLNFSSSSWMLATAGFVLLLHEIRRGPRRINYFIVCLLLLLSGLLRLQILLAVTILFLPAYIIYARKEYKKWVFGFIFIWGLLLLFNIQHQKFYRDQIPGWQKQEQIRQSLFYAYNRPLNNEKPWDEIFSDSTERAFYFSQFFFDARFLSPERMEQIGKALVRKRNFRSADDFQVLYWVFIEWRVYLLLFCVFFFLARQTGILKNILRKWFIPAILVIGVYVYLLLFLKLTGAIHMGLLTMLWLYFILAIPEPQPSLNPYVKRFPFSAWLLLLPFCWIGIRILKKSQDNRQKHLQFRCVIPEIIKNSDKLFIATDDTVPMDYFYIWDSPSAYKLNNLIYKDRVITNTYWHNLERFGISDIIQSIYSNPNVFLLGREFSELKQYYRNTYKVAITISEKLEGYKCLEIRKVNDSSGYSKR